MENQEIDQQAPKVNMTTEKIFVDIDPDNPVTEIESFCVSCEKNGITRILMTKIPYFKEIILMAFDCSECGYKSSEVQPGQSLADHGIHFELDVVSQKVIIKILKNKNFKGHE
jgi:zinc finger protein